MDNGKGVIEIIIPEDKDTLCRFCLKTSTTIVKINDSNEIKWPQNENFSESETKLSIKVNTSDRLPCGICKECSETVDNFMLFLDKLSTNEEILNSCYMDEDSDSLEKITVSTTDEMIVKIENDVTSDVFFDDHDYDVKVVKKIKSDLNSEYSNEKEEFDEEKLESSNNPVILKKIVSEPLNEPFEVIIKQCFFCPDKFASNEQYILHYVNHVVDATEEIVTHRPYCRHCGLLLTSKEEIEFHIEEEHPNEDALLFCKECNIKFSKAEDVLAHTERDHFENYEEELLYQKIKCPVCEKEFENAEVLIKHSLLHISRRYTCMKCKKIFVCDAAKNEHLNEHPEYVFRCPICRKLASGRSNLEAHIATHSTSRDFKCDICDRTYKTKNHLIYHKSSHSRPKSVCSICGYSTHSTKDFTTHSRTHSDERPFVCTFEDCGRAYKTNSALSSHVKSHLDIKEFSCDSCDYKTSRSVGLAIHKRIHTGERPYSCGFCGKTFNRKWNLTLHLRKLHP